jgi:hypothetical protein
VLRPHHFTRESNSIVFKQIKDLREHYGDELVSAMLGVHVYALSFQRQRLPSVRRLAFILHRFTFQPADPVSLFDILTCGKYERTPQPKPPEPAPNTTT